MAPSRPRVDIAAAVGYLADAGRLDRMAGLIGEAAEILVQEGIRPALPNHVVSWIETEQEYQYLMDAVPASILALGPDIGHLAWASVDGVAWMRGHAARVSNVHVKDLDLSIAAASRERPTPHFGTAARRFFLEPGLGDIPIVDALAQPPDDFGGSVIIEVDKPGMGRSAG